MRAPHNTIANHTAEREAFPIAGGTLPASDLAERGNQAFVELQCPSKSETPQICI